MTKACGLWTVDCGEGLRPGEGTEGASGRGRRGKWVSQCFGVWGSVLFCLGRR